MNYLFGARAAADLCQAAIGDGTGRDETTENAENKNAALVSLGFGSFGGLITYSTLISGLIPSSTLLPLFLATPLGWSIAFGTIISSWNAFFL